MLQKTGFFLFVLISALFVAPVVSAFPFTANMDGPSTVSLLEGMTVTIPLSVNNLDFEEHDVTITVDSDSKLIKVTPAIKKFSLNGYESTVIGLDVFATLDADHDPYDVTIIIDADGQKTEVPLNVYVGSNPFLTVSAFNSASCTSDFFDSVSVSVKNNTGSDATVLVKGEHPILFPTFEEESLFLESGEIDIVQLSVATLPGNAGDYEGVVYVQTDAVLVARPFDVSVNECVSPKEAIVSLVFPKKAKDLIKLQTTLFPVTVKNLTNKVQQVNLSVDSIIPASAEDLVLQPNESFTLNVSVSPALSTPAGTHPFKVTASASGYIISQSTNMKVLPFSFVQSTLVDSFTKVTKGYSEEMVFVVENKGDVSQTVSFGVQFPIPGIDFSFSP
ncbi:MAG: hypothetical protein AABY11_02685, partial [archaeon]